MENPIEDLTETPKQGEEDNRDSGKTVLIQNPVFDLGKLSDERINGFLVFWGYVVVLGLLLALHVVSSPILIIGCAVALCGEGKRRAKSVYRGAFRIFCAIILYAVGWKWMPGSLKTFRERLNNREMWVYIGPHTSLLDGLLSILASNGADIDTFGFLYHTYANPILCGINFGFIPRWLGFVSTKPKADGGKGGTTADMIRLFQQRFTHSPVSLIADPKGALSQEGGNNKFRTGFLHIANGSKGGGKGCKIGVAGTDYRTHEIVILDDVQIDPRVLFEITGVLPEEAERLMPVFEKQTSRIVPLYPKYTYPPVSRDIVFHSKLWAFDPCFVSCWFLSISAYCLYSFGHPCLSVMAVIHMFVNLHFFREHVSNLFLLLVSFSPLYGFFPCDRTNLTKITNIRLIWPFSLV